jgi:hypothetical protein
MLQEYVSSIQMFPKYVASVVYRCCKSRSGYCTCCNDHTCMFKVYVTNIFHLFQTYVVSILPKCCRSMHVASIYFNCFQVCHTYKCFICMFHMFVMIFNCFSNVFASVLDDCFKYFIRLLLYVANIAYRCFKSRSGVAHGHRQRLAAWATSRAGASPLLGRSLHVRAPFGRHSNRTSER